MLNAKKWAKILCIIQANLVFHGHFAKNFCKKKRKIPRKKKCTLEKIRDLCDVFLDTHGVIAVEASAYVASRQQLRCRNHVFVSE